MQQVLLQRVLSTGKTHWRTGRCCALCTTLWPVEQLWGAYVCMRGHVTHRISKAVLSYCMQVTWRGHFVRVWYASWPTRNGCSGKFPCCLYMGSRTCNLASLFAGHTLTRNITQCKRAQAVYCFYVAKNWKSRCWHARKGYPTQKSTFIWLSTIWSKTNATLIICKLKDCT